MNLYRTHSLSIEENYFFHIEGVELSKETRESLVEQAKEELLPNFDKMEDPLMREIYKLDAPDCRDLDEIHVSINNFESHVVNEGLKFSWNGHTPEAKEIVSLLHPEAVPYLHYMMLQSCKPYGFASPHVDSMYRDRRNTVIFLPLTPYDKEEFATLNYFLPGGKVLDVGFSPCYAASTNRIHGYENNHHFRAVVQIAFGAELKTIYNLHQQGKLIA